MSKPSYCIGAVEVTGSLCATCRHYRNNLPEEDRVFNAANYTYFNFTNCALMKPYWSSYQADELVHIK